MPTSEPAVESEPAAVEKEIDESLTGIEEYVPEESIVQETEKSTLEDNKELSESSEIVGSGNDTNTTVADESLSGLEMSLPVLECTAVGDEVNNSYFDFEFDSKIFVLDSRRKMGRQHDPLERRRCK